MLRMMLASNKGSLMELGIQPIITSGMILQLLAGANIINVNQNDKNERELFQSAQKLAGLLVTVGESVAYVSSGVYGSFEQLGIFNATLIVIQLSFAGLLVMLLDELLQKGYGLGSGISIFIACNTAETILWKAFSPMTITSGSDTEFEGAIIAFFHFLISKSNKLEALTKSFYRQNAPNLINLIATVGVILLVIYFQGYRVELPISAQKARGYRQSYPIKLFYTSNMPIILQSALISNLFFFSQMLYSNFKGNFLVRLLGTWQDVDMSGHSVPTYGLVYFLTPPRDLFDLFTSPVKTVVYIAFVLITCAVFSSTWIEVSNSSAKDVADQLDQQGMTVEGYRKENVKNYLNKYIPTAAALGGICIGALSIFADLVGAIGSGTGILMAVTIVYQMFETYAKEAAKEGGAGLF